MGDTVEKKRLDEARERQIPWKKWGSYLSERQWGTVREDYSENGDAWNFFTHDHARSRAYRWGEDGRISVLLGVQPAPGMKRTLRSRFAIAIQALASP